VRFRVLLGCAPGSLRKSAEELGIPVMVYEAGEALRFDEAAIRVGLRGIAQVLRRLAMLPPSKRPARPSIILRSGHWVRAEHSGIVRARVKLGTAVEKNATLGLINDPFGDSETRIQAPFDGVVIGRVNLPLVYEGEAMFHIGRTSLAEQVGEHWQAVQTELDMQPPELIEEPPIV
jgi:predicted deacylase